MTLVWVAGGVAVAVIVAVVTWRRVPRFANALRRLGTLAARLLALRKRPRGKLLIEWSIFTFSPVVLFPLFVFCASLFSRDQDLSLSAVGGRGDFAFMGVALAATAQVSVRRFGPSAQDPTENHPLAGLTMLALLFSAAAWGLAAGQGAKDGAAVSHTAEPAHALFFAVVGMIILAFCTLVAAAAACLDPRLSSHDKTLTFSAGDGDPP